MLNEHIYGVLNIFYLHSMHALLHLEIDCWNTQQTKQYRFVSVYVHIEKPSVSPCSAALILGLCPANERRRYKVTPSLIGWAQT